MAKENQPANIPDVSATELPAIKRGWLRAILIVPVWFAALIVFSLAAHLALADRAGQPMAGLIATPIGILLQMFQLLAVLVPVFLFRKFVDRRSLASLGFGFSREFRGDLLAGLAWGVGLITLVFLILRSAGWVAVTELQLPGVPFAVMIAVAIMVAVGEEVLLRGYVLSNLMTSMNKYVALLVVSLLFSATHLFNPSISIPGLLNIILAGLLLGIYYVHRRNLWFPIGLHYSWNLFQGAFYGSQVSGVTVESVLTVVPTGHELLTGGPFGFEASLVTTAVLTLATVVIHLAYRRRESATGRTAVSAT